MKKMNTQILFTLSISLLSTTSVFAAAQEEKSPQDALVDAILANAPRETLASLLRRGAQINTQSQDAIGDTPLARAVEWDRYVPVNISTIQSLIGLQADIWAQSKDGGTPLIRALTWPGSLDVPDRQKSIARLLLSQCKDNDTRHRYINLETKGGNALTQVVIASRPNQSAISCDYIRLLIREKADVNYGPPNNWPPLLWSITRDSSLSLCLLNEGADPDKRDSGGYSFRSLATSYPDHQKALKQFEETQKKKVELNQPAG